MLSLVTTTYSLRSGFALRASQNLVICQLEGKLHTNRIKDKLFPTSANGDSHDNGEVKNLLSLRSLN